MATKTAPNEQPGLTSSWVWLLVLFTFAGLVEAAFYGEVSAFTPLYLPHLGIPKSEVLGWTGIIVAISSAIGIPFLPFWGALADRYARQPIIVRSYVAHLIAAITMLLARNVWVYMLGRAAMSFSLGNSGLMMTTLSERVPGKRLGFAFSIMNGAPPMGLFLGPLLGGRIVDTWGFPTLLMINAGFLVAVLLILTFGYRDTFTGTNRGSLLRMAVDSIHIIWGSLRLRTLFPALFLLFSGWVMAFTYVPLAITALYHGAEPGTAVGLVLGVGGLVTVFLSPMIGTLADRFGHWRILFVAAVIEVFLWPLPALAPNLVLFGLVWAPLSGVASAVFAISFTVLSSSAHSDVRGRVMSFAYLPVNVGSLAGPGLGSIVASANVFLIFPLAAGLTALGIAALAAARRLKVEA